LPQRTPRGEKICFWQDAFESKKDFSFQKGRIVMSDDLTEKITGATMEAHRRFLR
jgi:hypothetical protein